ncbi:hypothetical protein SCB71_17530 [Herbiconiux sp. KACC 21604]|uniref:hypothetical protein n=1 Tax=unclassified Herbiconiux TaxID=2618217 RepID=UPI001490ECDF|nr:hypothetical protein [Herbiconiux sp. SALV-R1]QJU54877.1 hypothetical protein HL652_15480 [Herbiconiux sp. SALV-R1]WPO86000.1 hypothetical protein SCB71_17530 [Herbiconiux sp. KACC 21604]
MSEEHGPARDDSAALPAERVVSESVDEVTVRRAPRYYRFMAVGLLVGVIITVVATYSFPQQEDEEFSQLQVLGFTGIFVVAICVALGALVAIILDRVSRRRARTVAMEHIVERDEPAAATGSAPQNDERA